MEKDQDTPKKVAIKISSFIDRLTETVGSLKSEGFFNKSTESLEEKLMTSDPEKLHLIKDMYLCLDLGEETKADILSSIPDDYTLMTLMPLNIPKRHEEG